MSHQNLSTSPPTLFRAYSLLTGESPHSTRRASPEHTLAVHCAAPQALGLAGGKRFQSSSRNRWRQAISIVLAFPSRRQRPECPKACRVRLRRVHAMGRQVANAQRRAQVGRTTAAANRSVDLEVDVLFRHCCPRLNLRQKYTVCCSGFSACSRSRPVLRRVRLRWQRRSRAPARTQRCLVLRAN